MEDEEKTEDVNFIVEDQEVGDVYEIVCPHCKEKVRWARHSWKRAICNCGYEWSVELIATGTKRTDVVRWR